MGPLALCPLGPTYSRGRGNRPLRGLSSPRCSAHERADGSSLHEWRTRGARSTALRGAYSSTRIRRRAMPTPTRSPFRWRTNSGDTIGVQVSVTNHTPGLELTASIGDLLLADGTPVATQGTPGGTPTRVAGVQTSIVVNPAALPPSPERTCAYRRGGMCCGPTYSSTGRRASSKSLDIEVDPVQSQDWPPFGRTNSGGGPTLAGSSTRKARTIGPCSGPARSTFALKA